MSRTQFHGKKSFTKRPTPRTFNGCRFLKMGGYPCDLSFHDKRQLCDACQLQRTAMKLDAKEGK